MLGATTSLPPGRGMSSIRCYALKCTTPSPPSFTKFSKSPLVNRCDRFFKWPREPIHQNRAKFNRDARGDFPECCSPSQKTYISPRIWELFAMCACIEGRDDVISIKIEVLFLQSFFRNIFWKVCAKGKAISKYGELYVTLLKFPIYG